MSRIVRRAAALRDLDQHAEYIARHRPASADRFLDAAELSIRQLADTPFLGGLWESPNPTLAEMRVWPIRGFKNYLIYYRPIDDGVEVYRVLHAAQDIEAILGE